MSFKETTVVKQTRAVPEVWVDNHAGINVNCDT